MGEKLVMALAGIGEVLGKRLEEKGFDKVSLRSLPKADRSVFHAVTGFQI